MAVVFDLDGTLFDHRGAAAAGVRGWLAGMGAEASEEVVRSWLDAEERRVSAWQRGEVSWAEQRRQRLREILPQIARPVGDEAELDHVFGGYLSRYEAAWRCFDDVEDAVGMVASAGLRVAVLTNGAQRQQDQKLEAVGLSRIGPVLSSEALGFASPTPAPTSRRATSLGWRPIRCCTSAIAMTSMSSPHEPRDCRRSTSTARTMAPGRKARRIGSLSQLDRFLQ